MTAADYDTLVLPHDEEMEAVEYVSPTRVRAPARRWWVALAGVAVVLLGGATVAARSSGTSPTAGATSPTTVFTAGPCATPERRPENPTDEQRAEAAAAHAQLEDEIARTGFARYSTVQQDGTQICGWVKVNTVTMDDIPGFVKDGGADVVYDAPNGTPMGVSYMYLGYFPASVVSSPGFDPKQMRVQRYGCDPLGSTSCAAPTSTILGGSSVGTGELR